MKKTALLISFFLGSGLLALAWIVNHDSVPVRASAQGDIQRTFSVRPGGRLIMDVEPGAIEVKTTGDSWIVVDVLRKVERSSDGRAEEILSQHEVNFEQQGNDLFIRAKFPSGFMRWRRHGLQVRYVVSIPTEFNIDLKTSGGGIRVDDLRGEVRVKTSGGGLQFGKIEGPVIGNTSGGGITLAGCNGKVEVRTSGGGINIGSGAGDLIAETSGGGIEIADFVGDAVVRTSGGSIRINRIEGSIDASTSGGPIVAALSGQPKKDCRLHTSGGGITVELDESLALNINAEASGGGVTTDLPLTVQGELRKGLLRGTLNGGGQALILQTSGGGIHLRKLGRQ
jgi:Putative adhesin